MNERIMWCIISGVMTSISVYFWRKSILTKKGVWFIPCVVISLLMFFVALLFFDGRLSNMMMVLSLELPLLLFLQRIRLMFEFNIIKEEQVFKTVKNVSMLLIGCFWLLFVFLMCLLHFIQ